MNHWIFIKIIAIIIILIGMKLNHRMMTVLGVGLAVIGLFMTRKNIGRKS